jgi:hypothetical protein
MSFLKPNNSYNASLTADYTAGDATLSVNTIPTSFPTIVTVARGTTKETRFTVTGGSSGLLTGVTRLDGANENISSGVSVECMIDAEFITQLEAAVFTQVGLKQLLYAADGGSTDAYAITLPVAPDAYTDILGLPISFKANTINTGAATLNVNSLGAKAIKKNGSDALDDGNIKAGQIVTVVYDGTNFQLQTDIPASMDFSTLNAPQGFLINGKIVTSVASNNLTVAIKGLDGNDPSATNKVYVRIGNTVRTITAALSVTLNAGTNYFNAGGAVVATQEVDYFAYLGWKAASSAVILGVSRIGFGRVYSDFSGTSTNEKYLATSSTPASTDEVENIGRFNATLSASASFNWSIPATSIIVNRPIFKTRHLTYNPNWNGYSVAPTGGTYIYRLDHDQLKMSVFRPSDGTSNSATNSITAPFTALVGSEAIAGVVDQTAGNAIAHVRIQAGASEVEAFVSGSDAGFVGSGTKNIRFFTLFASI